jgi:hypothetical protein
MASDMLREMAAENSSPKHSWLIITHSTRGRDIKLPYEMCTKCGETRYAEQSSSDSLREELHGEQESICRFDR